MTWRSESYGTDLPADYDPTACLEVVHLKVTDRLFFRRLRSLHAQCHLEVLAGDAQGSTFIL